MSGPENQGESMWAKLKKLNVEIKMPKRGAPKAEKPSLDEAKADEPKVVEPTAQTPNPEPSAEPGELAVPEFVEEASKSRKPNIRMPKVKAPQFRKPQFRGRELALPPTVTGAIENLRERGLLPVAIVLVAAILAVPFLLSGGSSSPPPKAEPSAEAAADAVETQQAVVLANNPGVREYKKRLDGSSKDPFVQQYKVPESGGGGAATGVQQVGGGTGSVEPTAPAGGTGGASETTATPDGSSAKSGLYHYGADLYVSVAGKKNPKLWRNVKRTTSLPNKNVKVAAFIGVPIDKPDVATFLVSSDVVQIGGKGNCTLGDGCELISVKVGDQIKLTAANGVTYAIKVADTYIIHDKAP